MIDLPKSVLLKRLDSELKRGKVLRTILEFNSKPYFKRLILLNNNFDNEDIYFFISTSRLDWYSRNLHINWVKINYLYVRKGETKDNLNEDMIIKCDRVYTIKKERLLENLVNRKLEFLDEIPVHLMEKIDLTIFASKLIPPKIKKMVLP